MSEKKHGVVKWFNDSKGFGFIHCEGLDYFVHFSAIKSQAGFKSLVEGQKVTFVAGTSDKGLQAEDVELA